MVLVDVAILCDFIFYGTVGSFLSLFLIIK